MTFRIPDCGTHPYCPKCGGEAELHFTIAFHPGMITNLAWGGDNPPCVKLYLDHPEEMAAQLGDGGHLCRSCKRCRYAWVEKPHAPGDVYAVVEGDDADG